MRMRLLGLSSQQRAPAHRAMVGDCEASVPWGALKSLGEREDCGMKRSQELARRPSEAQASNLECLSRSSLGTVDPRVVCQNWVEWGGAAIPKG